MAKTLKFPLAVFLLLALAYIIPPDGASALKCFHCTPSGGSTPCDTPETRDCKTEEKICQFTELPMDNVIDRGCAIGSSSKEPNTCLGDGVGRTAKSCYCNTDLCNFNFTTAISPTTKSPENATTDSTDLNLNTGSTEGLDGNGTNGTTEEICEVVSDSTSTYGRSRTPFLILSFTSVLFISASFFGNN